MGAIPDFEAAMQVIRDLEQENERLKEADGDYQSRLWCALGQPINIEYIKAVKQLRQERDALKAQVERMSDALKQTCEICEDGDTGADFGRVVAAMNTAHDALAARAAEPGSKEGK